MKFYTHHIRDFNNATRHLTRIERSIYRDLQELYYDTEAPLMLDVAKLSRKVVANTDDEKGAVINVLAEFFIETPEGWRHERCDEEVAAARVKMDEADDRRENDSERQRRHRDRRKDLFARLREFDEVPPYDTKTEQLQLRLDAHLSRVTSERRTSDATANHNPLPTTQLPLTIEQEDQDLVAQSAQAGVADQDGDDKPDPSAKPPSASSDVQAVFAHWKLVMESPRSLLDSKRIGLIKGALKTGYTVEQLCQAIDGCRKSPYHMGQNDRGRPYNGLDLILRGAEKIDQFIVIGTSSLVPQERRSNGRPSINNIGVVPGADDDIFNQMRKEL